MAKNGDKSLKKKEALNVAVIPSRDISSQRIYSNFISVSNSPLDFTLTFCDAPPLNDENRKEAIKSGIVKAPIQVEIAIPIALVEPLIKALSSHYEKYKK